MPLSLCETGTLSPSSLTPHSASGLLIQLCDDLERGSHTTGLCNWPHHSARPPALRTLSGLPSFSRPGRRPCVARACGRVTLPMWTKYVAGSAHPCGPSTWPGHSPRVNRARGQVTLPVWTEHVARSASPCGPSTCPGHSPVWPERVAGSLSPCGPSTWPGHSPRVDRVRGWVTLPVWTESVAGSVSPCGPSTCLGHSPCVD